MIQNAGRPDRESDDDTGIQDAPGCRWQFFDNSHQSSDPDGHPPGYIETAWGSPPESHAIEGCQQVIEGIVSLACPDHERKGPLDDQGSEFFVESLVALGICKDGAAQGVQTMKWNETKRTKNEIRFDGMSTITITITSNNEQKLRKYRDNSILSMALQVQGQVRVRVHYCYVPPLQV